MQAIEFNLVKKVNIVEDFVFVFIQTFVLVNFPFGFEQITN